MKRNGPEEILASKRDEVPETQAGTPANPSRRSFFGKLGGAAAAAIVTGAIPLEPLIGGKESEASAAVAGYDSSARAAACLAYRQNTATADNIDVGVQPDNGDAALYP